MHKDVDRVLVSREEIHAKCIELGKQITKDYTDRGELPILVGLLNGSVPFMSELMKNIEMDVEIDFMDVSSYEGTQSVGSIRINKDMGTSAAGKSILLVEDIVDTGKTLTEVKRMLANKGAKDVRVVSLLDKPDRRTEDIEADYVGFTIPNEFVIGYGLDYNQKYRNLPYVGILKPEVYEES
ncbi:MULTISPECIES: hypoxanthine phosphoribosyltransferase [Breznakia]|uniref:Hypoxanthine phosphoribosyltransferase n=1 Tax=Breznakia blatticola TaxID=1754012 RepID=A0A4R7ZAV8_9FIRM|nr:MULTISPECIES: hypoxanthine phosphoribosyltransferase [Breznakia]MDH6366979.1 hypoxanthine phosphoribosyltransferase [Breznakia sp. PH1-1]MDH6404249.1 hypoxanthine phosphoribosyltransferase [Breznakia sp. PF1-11]MDH6411866.1 hypoxanthine phosphoribosyltransferase [Breznakia sp. PFB1-11]MDH6414237.1 hypoxanthine phosphoribosyltransferase [Breznakia sp. PFB1-14]MDH6415939.1 hypoxanthine phosphoribosyltransferase [Breznakia sp. PFB1-4]